MPKRLACAVALIMFAGYSAALAADFGRPPPPPAYPGALPPPVYPIFSWTGIYVGVNGGGAFGQSNWSDPFFGTTGDFDVSGGLFGGTIGGNYQFIGTPFVVGIEGDADWANISGTTFSRQAGVKWWAANLGAIFSPQYGDVLVGRGAARCSTEQRAPRSVTSRLLQARFLSVARQRRVGPLA